jgi:hypothetical protein
MRKSLLSIIVVFTIIAALAFTLYKDSWKQNPLPVPNPTTNPTATPVPDAIASTNPAIKPTQIPTLVPQPTLSTYIYVSGAITKTPYQTQPSRIIFVDTKTGATFSGYLVGNSYSVTLQNGHNYIVTCYWVDLFEHTGSFTDSLVVHAPLGLTSTSHNFSG